MRIFSKLFGIILFVLLFPPTVLAETVPLSAWELHPSYGAFPTQQAACDDARMRWDPRPIGTINGWLTVTAIDGVLRQVEVHGALCQVRVTYVTNYETWMGPEGTQVIDWGYGNWMYPACPEAQPPYTKDNNGTTCSRRVVILDRTKKNPDQCPIVGNPITPSTGNKQQIETDYTGAGPFPLVFQRTYNSVAQLGAGWSHFYDRRVAVERVVDPVTSVSVSTATIKRPNGKTYTFTLSGNAWVADADINDQLMGSDTTGWIYTLGQNNDVETYDMSGKLQFVAFSYPS